MFDALHSVLSGNSVSPRMSRPEDIIPLLYERDPLDGCWVYQIPDDWVKLMSEIDADEVSMLTKRLVKTCWTLKTTNAAGRQTIEPYLICLRDISKQALKKKSSLLLWASV